MPVCVDRVTGTLLFSFYQAQRLQGQAETRLVGSETALQNTVDYHLIYFFEDRLPCSCPGRKWASGVNEKLLKVSSGQQGVKIRLINNYL